MEELKDKIKSFNFLITRLEKKYPQYTDRNKMHSDGYDAIFEVINKIS